MSDTVNPPVDAEGCDPALDETTVERLSIRLEKRAIDDAVSLFSAVGSETRYRLLVFLGTVDQDVCVCELEATLDVGQSAISQALSRLREAGLVKRRKDGRWRYYTTTPLADQLLAVTTDDLDTEQELQAV